MLKKFVGDKKFYKLVMAVALPIILQNGIMNFVNLLDNIMVGSLSAAEFSAVAISNQLVFVFNLCLFGIVSGAGIFSAQFYGKGDDEGVRNTMRIKLVVSAVFTAVAIAVFLLFGKNLISLWLNDTENVTDMAITLQEGYKYLKIIIIGFIPIMFMQSYADTLRSTGETVLPMKASAAALVVNLFFNWLFIFEHWGFFGWGVSGAAAATVLARFVECAVVVIYTHKNSDRHTFIKGVYKTFKVPAALVKRVIITGFPLMMNEALWGLGMTAINQGYSIRGMVAVNGISISSTIVNMFNIVMMAIGSSVGIIVGKILGSGDMKKARDYDTKLIAFSTAVSAVVGVIVIITAPIFTTFYNVDAETAATAVGFMRISAAFMPLHGFLHASYFTLRSGGKTGITFLFDAGYMWVLAVPINFIIGRFTDLPVLTFYFLVGSVDFVKCVVGFILVKKGVWLKNIVDTKEIAQVE